MGTQALYRRWRSRTFAEILGQDHITHTLLNALRAGRIAHAYLFSGPRGTGKTTTARVLAKAVNCLDPQDGEPCNRCTICSSMNEGRALDLIEIDAASNRGIDEIRALREKIAFSPTECRYKVYVVDEVHMLTNEAFNALLKTLEEPPPHAIFVLATTAPHKIPTTVLSRCQRFDFRRISMPHLKQKLELICTQEEVRVEPAAIDAIARYAAGSFRDAESLLDQLVSYGTEEIKLDDVRRVLGSAPGEVISGIVNAVVTGDPGAGLRLVNEALDGGVEPRRLTHEVLEYLRGMLLLKNGGAALLSVPPEMLKEMTAQTESLSLLRLLRTVRLFNQAANQLKTGLHSQLPLELALVEAALTEEREARPEVEQRGARVAQPVPSARSQSAASQPAEAEEDSAAAASNASPPTPPPAEAGVAEAVQEEPPTPAAASSGGSDEGQESPMAGAEITQAWLQENWGRLLQAIRPRNRAVEALLKSCEPMSVRGDCVTLGFYFGFHRDRVNEDKNRAVVEEALAELAGRALRVKCSLCQADREQKENDSEAKRREELLDNPVVREAIQHYGAKVVDVQ
jgi:DNA polymerase-3 subunit gamma/tau